MPVREEFRKVLVQRLDEFYSDLAKFGEVAPGVRFRLEGFIEAGLCLQLIAATEVQKVIADAYQIHMGAVAPALPGKPEPYHLPIRWQRAPVFPSGGSRS